MRKHYRRGVLIRKPSENMQQIYRRTPMWKYDWNHTSPLVLSCKFAAYFQNLFHQNTFGGGSCFWKWRTILHVLTLLHVLQIYLPAKIPQNICGGFSDRINNKTQKLHGCFLRLKIKKRIENERFLQLNNLHKNQIENLNI